MILINFSTTYEAQDLLTHAKTRVESSQVAIDSRFDKLIVSLRTEIEQEGKLQEEISIP